MLNSDNILYFFVILIVSSSYGFSSESNQLSNYSETNTTLGKSSKTTEIFATKYNNIVDNTIPNSDYTFNFEILNQQNPKYRRLKRKRKDSTLSVERGPRYESNSLFLKLALPHLNIFSLKPDGEPQKSHAGFWGVSFGFDYAYLQNRFISISAGGVVDFFLPFPAVVDPGGESELMTSEYITLTDNFEFKSITVGYGLSYAKNTWRLSYAGTDSDFEDMDAFLEKLNDINPRSKACNIIGLAFPLYLKLGESMILGAIYRPSWIRFSDENSFAYEHVISIEFGWVIGIF